MFVFAIETCGKTVAFTKEVDRIMLEGILNGQRDEGQQLRDGLVYLRDTVASRLWDGVAPFTARLATESEELDYDLTAAKHLPDCDGESLLMFCFKNNRENFLVIPLALRRAA
jgi:hypothetical protein